MSSKATEVLRRMEWSGTWNDYDSRPCCPECEECQTAGHASDCALAAALADDGEERERYREALTEIANHKPDRDWSEMGKQCIIDGLQETARRALEAGAGEGTARGGRGDG